MKVSGYILLLLFFCNFIAIGQNKVEYSAEITTWFHDKQAAVSITFDDADYTQYQFAYPILDKYHLKATFSLVGEWTKDKPTYSAEEGMFKIKKMGWNEILELSKKGHEIAAHGYEHKRYGKRLSTDILSLQMKKIKDLIENKIHKTVYTLHYPYSFTSDSIVKGADKAGFLFGRTQGDHNYNNPKFNNRLLLNSRAIINNTNPDTIEFKQWVNEAKGKWLILMYHRLFTKDAFEMSIMKNHNVTNTYSLYPDTFDKQMKYLASSGYWIAPVADIGRYAIERENTLLKMSICKKSIKIKTITNLDENTYNIPLTLKVKLPWKKVKVSGSNNDGIFEVINNAILIDFLPGKTIKIRKKK